MELNKLKNKKGIIEVITMIVLLFIVAIGFIAVIFTGLKLNDTLGPKLAELQGSDESFTPMNETINKTIGAADYLFLALFVLLLISIIITSFLFFSHPVFLVIYIILAVGAIIVSVPISNAYEKVSQIGVFNESVSHLPIVDYILLHLPLFTLGIIIISIIVIYAKSQSGSAMGGGGMTQM